MATLANIIEAAKANAPLAPDDARSAICVLEALAYYDTRALNGRNSKGSYPFYTLHAETECLRRWRRAWAESPQQWLGQNHPANPEYQARRHQEPPFLPKDSGWTLLLEFTWRWLTGPIFKWLRKHQLALSCKCNCGCECCG